MLGIDDFMGEDWEGNEKLGGLLREGHREEAAARAGEGVGDIVGLLGCGCWLCHIETD